MKIPYYKGIDKDTGKMVEGFYFEYPRTTYCFSTMMHPIEIIPCLVFWQPTDWGLLNQPMLCQNIDKSTLELIGYIDTNKNQYEPTNWLEKINKDI